MATLCPRATGPDGINVRLRHNHHGHPFSTAFTPDGKILASGGQHRNSPLGLRHRKVAERNQVMASEVFIVFWRSRQMGSSLAGAGLYGDKYLELGDRTIASRVPNEWSGGSLGHQMGNS